MPSAAEIDIKFTSSGADRVEGDIKRLNSSVQGADRQSQSFFKSAMAAGVGFMSANIFGNMVSGITSFAKSGFTAGLDFEQGMSNVHAVTGATGDELKSLSNLALKIGSDTSFGANDAASAIEQLAMAGVSTEAILNGAADGAVALAAAGGVALPEAAIVMSNALNQFGLDGSQATHVADLLAAASSTSATGVTELGESLKYVGTSAHALGIPIEDITTALAVMADQGLVGSMAGTALNNALSSMANPTDQARQAMDELGVSFFDAQGVMKPLPTILSELATATSGLTAEQRAAYLETIFGVEGGRAMNALLASQTDQAKKAGKGWQDYYASITKSGAAAEQAKARMNNFRGDLENMKGSLETLAIIGTMAVLPMFRGVVQGITKGFSAAGQFLSTFQSLREQGMKPMAAASLALRAALVDTFGLETADKIKGFADGTLKAIGNILSIGKDVGTGLVKIFQGDIPGAMLAFGRAAQGAWDILRGIGLAVGDLAMDVLDWTINTGIPAVAGWLADHAGDILAGVVAITGWVVGKAIDLVGWTINVLVPKLAMAAFDLAKLILAELGKVVVDLFDWTLRVGIPHVTIAGWDTVDLLLTALNQQIIVPLTDWIIALTPPEVILAAGALSQWIGDKVRGDGPARVEALAQILPILTSPVAIPALVTAYIISKMPDSVKTTIATTVVNTFKLIQATGSLVSQVSQYVFNSLVGVTFKAIALVSVGVSLTVQGWSDTVAAFFQSLADTFTNADWSLSIPTPDIDWPNPMDWVPDDIKQFFTDPLGYIKSQVGGGSKANGGNGSKGGASGGPHSTNGLMPGGGGPGFWEQFGNADRIRAMGAPHGQQTTITVRAIDLATPTVAAVKAALLSIPPEKLSQLKQAGGEAVSAVAGIAKGALERIPTSWLSSLKQQGGEQVTATAGTTRQAISNIPTSWLSNLRQAGGEAVTSIAHGARGAISGIPTSWFTSIAQSGAASVASAAREAANAVNGIPSFKSVTVSIVVSGLSAAQNALAAVGGHARGGYVTEAVSWLAEEGRELLRFPNGSWFMAQAKGLFSVPKGTFVYTNPETERMIGSLAPVRGYASGGTVGGGPSIMPMPLNASSGPPVTLNLLYISREDVEDIFDTVDAMKMLTNPDELRALLGGAA